MAISKQTMTDEQRKSVALEYLKAFDDKGVTSTGAGILGALVLNEFLTKRAAHMLWASPGVARTVKTEYIYNMSRLVNVRLDEKRLERARRLRAKGVTLSDLVRDAIDRQYDKLVQPPSRPDVVAVMKELYEQYPDAPALPDRNYEVHDRAQARAAVLRKLRMKR